MQRSSTITRFCYQRLLFIRFGKSESLRKGVLMMLKGAAAKSDNDVDDAIVKMIEEKLFPVK